MAICKKYIPIFVNNINYSIVYSFGLTFKIRFLKGEFSLKWVIIKCLEVDCFGGLNKVLCNINIDNSRCSVV